MARSKGADARSYQKLSGSQLARATDLGRGKGCFSWDDLQMFI